MKNKSVCDKVLFYIQLVALVFLGISAFLFIWSIFVYPQNNIKVIMFNLVGDTLVFVFAIIFFLIEFVYALLYGIIRKKIHITFLSVFLLVFVLFNFIYMSLVYEETEYKVEIEEVNETLIITDKSSLHDCIQTIYEKKFFIFYKEIYSEYNTSLSNENRSEIVFENNQLILKYYNEQSEYNDPYLIKFLDYKNKEFILSK